MAVNENSYAADQAPQTDAFPSAAERDAAKRAQLETDSALQSSEFAFVTRNLSDTEKAATVAALMELRAAETRKVKKVARIEREPWRRSQRSLRRIEDFFDGA